MMIMMTYHIFWCSIVLLFIHTIIQISYCAFILLFKTPLLLLLKYPMAHIFQCLFIQLFNYPNAQLFQYLTGPFSSLIHISSSTAILHKLISQIHIYQCLSKPSPIPRLVITPRLPLFIGLGSHMKYKSTVRLIDLLVVLSKPKIVCFIPFCCC